MAYDPFQPPPTLDAILATLSTHGPPHHANPSSYRFLPPASFEAASHLSPYQNFPTPLLQASPPTVPPKVSACHNSPSPSPQPPATPQSAQSNASTIISWPPALRHMFSLSQNQEVVHRIRHLIQQQHDHERQWWRGREELVRKQGGRNEARGKLDGVLKGLGGHVAASNNVSVIVYAIPCADATSLTMQDPESDTRELEQYDKKVCLACGEMIAATEKELKALGVPFFDVEEELIGRKGGGMEEGGDRGGKIGQEELNGLRGRMLKLLEELCQE